MEGRLTQCEKILNLLSDGHWHSMRELNQICFRYGARLHDLKKQGIDHKIVNIKGVNYYKLVKQNEHQNERKKNWFDRFKKSFGF
jgi:hypothetical protein